MRDSIKNNIYIIWDDVSEIGDGIHTLCCDGKNYVGIDNCCTIIELGDRVKTFVVDILVMVKSSSVTLIIDKNTYQYREYTDRQFMPYKAGYKHLVLISKGHSNVDAVLVLRRDDITEIKYIKSLNYWIMGPPSRLLYREWSEGGKQSEIKTVNLDE